MRRMTVALLAICLIALCIQAGTGRSGKVKPFNSAEWQTSFADAFNKKNANLVKKHLSRIYNVTGESRDEFANRLDKAFKQFDTVALEYDVLEVKQPAPDHAVLKIRSVLKGVRSDTKQTVTLAEKQGFDSLVFEAGSWRMFDSVAVRANINRNLGPGMEELVECPDGVWRDDSGGSEGGGVWRTQQVGNRTFAQSLTFDPRAWEAQVAQAWQSKDVELVGNLYSDLYSHAGRGRTEVLSNTATFFNTYGKITCKYRVVSYKYVGSGLVSVKADVQLFTDSGTGGAANLIFQTFGFGSLINENGAWKLYATQPGE